MPWLACRSESSPPRTGQGPSCGDRSSRAALPAHVTGPLNAGDSRPFKLQRQVAPNPTLDPLPLWRRMKDSQDFGVVFIPPHRTERVDRANIPASSHSHHVHVAKPMRTVLTVASRHAANPHDAPSGGFAFFVGLTIGRVVTTPVLAAASSGSMPLSRKAFQDLALPATSAA